MSDDNNNGQNLTSDLGSWLISMGAPVSITELMPTEITGLDMAPLMTMLGGIGIRGGVRGSIAGEQSADTIRWLPIIY